MGKTLLEISKEIGVSTATISRVLNGEDCVSPETREKRRYIELTQKGQNVTFEQVMEEMVARDAQDEGREIAPAIPADDAIMYDNSGLTFDESLDALLAFIKEKLGDKLGDL